MQFIEALQILRQVRDATGNEVSQNPDELKRKGWGIIGSAYSNLEAGIWSKEKAWDAIARAVDEYGFSNSTRELLK